MSAFSFLARTSRRCVPSVRRAAATSAGDESKAPPTTGLEENVEATKRLGKQMEALSDSIVVSTDGTNDVQVRSFETFCMIFLIPEVLIAAAGAQQSVCEASRQTATGPQGRRAAAVRREKRLPHRQAGQRVARSAPRPGQGSVLLGVLPVVADPLRRSGPSSGSRKSSRSTSRWCRTSCSTRCGPSSRRRVRANFRVGELGAQQSEKIANRRERLWLLLLLLLWLLLCRR